MRTYTLFFVLLCALVVGPVQGQDLVVASNLKFCETINNARQAIALFHWLTAPSETTNERLIEVILYLGVTLAQVFAWRRLPQGPLAPPMVDDVMLTRWSEKRTGTVASFLAGKQAQATPLPEASPTSRELQESSAAA